VQLPVEMLSMIVGWAPFRAVLHLGLVNRRLYQLVHEGQAASSPNRSSMWRNCPPITFDVEERIDVRRMLKWRIVRKWVVRVGDDRFDFKRRDREQVPSLLLVLRHISELYLVFQRVGRANNDAEFSFASTALFDSLRQFSQLRSLCLRGVPDTPMATMAAALESLPALRSLDVLEFECCRSEQLAALLHRLCSSQLDHAALTYSQLCWIDEHHRDAAMTRLRSLTVVPKEYEYDFTVVGGLLDMCFPALSHLALSCHQAASGLGAVPLPPLRSLTLHYTTDADLSHNSTIAFRLCCAHPTAGEKIRSVLTRAPQMRQLAICFKRTASDLPSHVFPPAASSALSRLVHLEFLDSLTLADLTYLLTPTSPPVFATQLTHLALRVNWYDRTAAAALLPALPSMYPSLTHVHIGVEGKWNSQQLTASVKWDVAVRLVRAAVGSAWCDSADEVLACREDVMWRRSIGLPI